MIEILRNYGLPINISIDGFAIDEVIGLADAYPFCWLGNIFYCFIGQI